MSPAPVGSVRLFGSGNSDGVVQKVVYICLTVPPIGLDSHMLFAFTKATSAIPHFHLDAVKAGPSFAFHLDVVPRVDLGANLRYINAVFDPLTPTWTEAKKIDGLTAADVGPKQQALFSPWMLTNRATESAFAQIEKPVNEYLDHWFRLVEQGLPADAAAPGDGAHFAHRDQQNRNAVFDPEVDKVWAQVDRLVGAQTSAALRAILKNQGVEEEPPKNKAPVA